jgi:hypothetical protein
MRGRRAIWSALDLAAAPALAAAARRQDLPDGVIELIRIVAGCPEALEAATRLVDRSEQEVRAAAEFYVTQILLHDGADARRVLGVSKIAGRDEMRAHMALLMLWLHPDHAKSDWEAAFAQRVVSAWRELSAGAPPRQRRRAPRRLTRLRAAPSALMPAPARAPRRGVLAKILLVCALAALIYVMSDLTRGGLEANSPFETAGWR